MNSFCITCLRSSSKFHCKVDYLEQFNCSMSNKSKLACFFLKLDKRKCPLCLWVSMVSEVVPLCILLLEPFITFLQGVEQHNTSPIPIADNFVCLVLQFCFCMIDSWSRAWFISWHYSLNHVYHGQFLIFVFPRWQHYIHMFPVFVSCLTLST